MNSKLKVIFQFFFIVLITVFVLYYSSEIASYSHFGYIGVFIISLLSSATVIIPAPGWIVVLELGRVLNPLILAFCSGAGSAIGELTGYFIGGGISELANDSNISISLFKKHKRWIKKNSFFTILILAFVPNPLFDIAGMSAGALKMDIKLFLLATFIGKIFKFLLISYLGFYSLSLF